MKDTAYNPIDCVIPPKHEGCGLPILSPLDGTVAPLSSVPDPIFAVGTVGAGLAVVPDPSNDPHHSFIDIIAPVSGRLLRVLPHVFIIQSDSVNILVHLGVDTVYLDEQCCTPLSQEGQYIEVGDTVVGYNPAYIRSQGYDPVVMVVAMKEPQKTIKENLHPGEPCFQGDILFHYRG